PAGPVIFRLVTVAPVAAPALSPILYGVVLVQVTATVVLTSEIATVYEPKARAVVEIVQVDATVAVTRNVAVCVAAAAGVEAGPSARNPATAAESANFTI